MPLRRVAHQPIDPTATRQQTVQTLLLQEPTATRVQAALLPHRQAVRRQAEVQAEVRQQVALHQAGVRAAVRLLPVATAGQAAQARQEAEAAVADQVHHPEEGEHMNNNFLN